MAAAPHPPRGYTGAQSRDRARRLADTNRENALLLITGALGGLSVAGAGVAAAGGLGADAAEAGAAGGIGSKVASTAGKDLASGALKKAGAAATGVAFFESLKNPAVWWRIVEGVIGLVLGYLGIKQFTAAAGGSQAVVTPKVPAVVPV